MGVFSLETRTAQPPIPQSALEKDPRPGPLFEGNPVGEGMDESGGTVKCMDLKHI